MDIKGKKILVTGGAGFIGSHTANALIEKGADVVIIDNLSTGKKENLNPKAIFYELNAAGKKVKDIFEKEKPEIVYHFAFNVLVPESVENPLLELDSISSSLNVLMNARDFGVKKFIFASSGFVYGNSLNFPTPEESLIDPISPYVVSKSAVENFIKFFNKAFSLPYVILRYGTVYGPGQEKGAMSDYIRKLSSGHQAEIWGDGSKTRDYVYIEDVVNANLLAIDFNGENAVFNIANGKETSLNEVYGKIAEFLGKKPAPIFLKDREGELMRNCLDISRAKKVLNWKPEFGLKNGLKLRLEKEGYL